MDTIIGLGEAGCNIAEEFLQYPQYNVYMIDSVKRKTEAKFKKLVSRSSHEEYENKCPSMKAFFKDVEGSVLFVLGGSGMVTGASLKILSYLKKCKINVLFVKPDLALMTEDKRTQHKIVFQVLQQYARSSVLERMYVVDNAKLENILGELPVIGYYEKINSLVASTVHMLNVYTNINSVMNTFSPPRNSARISTMGLLNPETGVEQTFYDLQHPREKLYFYAINHDKLLSNGSLMKTITGQVKSKADENLRTSYGIFSTNYEQDYGYVICHATYVQESDI